ncbi:MAG: secretin N-terminal domain-containing protein [Acidobacteriota bacterium]
MIKFRLTIGIVLMTLSAGILRPQQPPPAAPVTVGTLSLDNASLRTVVMQLAQQLKINVIIDDRVQGAVTMNTYGEPGNIDARNLLELILRLNGAGMIQEGEIYRIVPLQELVRQPISRASESGDIPDDDRTMLNLVFLKYVTVDEVSKVLQEFSDDRTIIRSYAPANLLFIMDSRRNMRRLMDLIALFDSDKLAGDRVRIFDIRNTLPSELLKDLEKILKSISLSKENSTVRFLPVDRLSKLIAVAPNPGVFERVEMWIRTLDVAITETSTVIDTYVYQVKYGRADCLAMALNQLYYPNMNSGYSAGGNYGGNQFQNNGNYGGGYQNGAQGNPYGSQNGNSQYGPNGNNSGYANQNSFNNGFGGAGACGGLGSMGGMGGGGNGYGNSFGGYAAQTPQGAPVQGNLMAPTGAAPQNAQGNNNGFAFDGPTPPRIVPNPLANNLLIQANAQQYQSVLKLLRELDRPPRQILLEAKIFSVVLSGSFTAGVETRFQQRTGTDRRLVGSIVGNVGRMNAGFLVGQARELLFFLSLQENASNVHILSQPSLIATDSIPASINVGTQVPVLTGSVSTLGGTSSFTSQGISSHNTGATLQVNARSTPSGVVTLMINQEISKVSPNNPSSNIGTPAFDQQVVQTQITLQDGDTIAIGGIISETTSSGSQGIPGLNRLPGIGALFGSQQRSHDRTELVLFMTPHIIYDTTDLLEASEQVKNSMRNLRKYYVE